MYNFNDIMHRPYITLNKQIKRLLQRVVLGKLCNTQDYMGNSSSLLLVFSVLLLCTDNLKIKLFEVDLCMLIFILLVICFCWACPAWTFYNNHVALHLYYMIVWQYVYETAPRQSFWQLYRVTIHLSILTMWLLANIYMKHPEGNHSVLTLIGLDGLNA